MTSGKLRSIATETLSVSIAMTTFNGRRFLREQLDSLAAQTHIPFELVIVDDCSSDDTVDILQAFAQKVPFPVVIRQNNKNIGYKANFMRCVDLCSGHLIAFCDQDDVWMPSKLARVVEEFKKHECLLVHHRFSIIDQAGKQRGLAPKLESRGPWAQLYGFSAVIDRRLLAQNSLWSRSKDHFDASQPMAHDQWFGFLADLTGSSVLLDKSLVAYRQHAANACGFEVPRPPGDGIVSQLKSVWLYLINRDPQTFLAKRRRLQELFRNRANSALSRLTIAKRLAITLNVRPDRLALYMKAYESFYLRSCLHGRLGRRARLHLFLKVLQRGYVGMGRKTGLKEMILDVSYGVLARD